jgi:hypothetical protein
MNRSCDIFGRRIGIQFAVLAVTAFLSLQIAQHAQASPTTRPDQAPAQVRALHVVLYDDTGAAHDSIESIENSLKAQTPGDYSIRRTSGQAIRNGVLDWADVAIFPGGSGHAQAKSLDPAGREKIRQFVERGGGYLGIDGGAYLATTYYPWSLNIINATIVDRAHWARGQAQLRLDLNTAGKQLLASQADSLFCDYNEGPLLGPDNKPDLPAYQPLATFGTEVAENGAPAGVMIGTHAMIRAVFGHGRVLLISPHPEQTDGLGFIVRAAVKWISQPEITANPLTGDTTNAQAALRPPLAPITQSASSK